MNLIPLLELDGYWIFSDLIQVPNLRRRSLTFMQHDLWHKIRTVERWSWQEGGLAFYGIIGTVFTLFVVPSIYMLIARARTAESTEMEEAAAPAGVPEMV